MPTKSKKPVLSGYGSSKSRKASIMRASKKTVGGSCNFKKLPFSGRVHVQPEVASMLSSHSSSKERLKKKKSTKVEQNKKVVGSCGKISPLPNATLGDFIKHSVVVHSKEKQSTPDEDGWTTVVYKR